MKIICLCLLQILFLCNTALAQSEETNKSQEFYKNLSYEDYEKLLATETTYLLYDDLGAIKVFAEPHWQGSNALVLKIHARALPNFYSMSENGHIKIGGIFTSDDLNVAKEDALDTKYYLRAKKTYGFFEPYYFEDIAIVGLKNGYDVNAIVRVEGEIIIDLPVDIKTVVVTKEDIGKEFEINTDKIIWEKSSDEFITFSSTIPSEKELFFKVYDADGNELAIRRKESSSSSQEKTTYKAILSATPYKIIFAVPTNIVQKAIKFELK